MNLMVHFFYLTRFYKITTLMLHINFNIVFTSFFKINKGKLIAKNL